MIHVGKHLRYVIASKLELNHTVAFVAPLPPLLLCRGERELRPGIFGAVFVMSVAFANRASRC